LIQKEIANESENERVSTNTRTGVIGAWRDEDDDDDVLRDELLASHKAHTAHGLSVAVEFGEWRRDVADIVVVGLVIGAAEGKLVVHDAVEAHGARLGLGVDGGGRARLRAVPQLDAVVLGGRCIQARRRNRVVDRPGTLAVVGVLGDALPGAAVPHGDGTRIVGRHQVRAVERAPRDAADLVGVGNGTNGSQRRVIGKDGVEIKVQNMYLAQGLQQSSRTVQSTSESIRGHERRGVREREREERRTPATAKKSSSELKAIDETIGVCCGRNSGADGDEYKKVQIGRRLSNRVNCSGGIINGDNRASERVSE